jgi:nucleoside-diphosphate-sugar epimerase
MRSALIGSTGFVGSTLLRQTSFDEQFHSTDIERIRGQSYGLLVCAGAPAEKWKANRDPESDRANLQRLMQCLAEVHAEHVVLISTVDVYPVPVGVDEGTTIDPEAGSAYGRHRFELEVFVRDRFDTTCVRLPGLFGRGLKKNVIYDFLNNNETGAICPDSVYQFYGLDDLWRDIAQVRAHGLSLVNFGVEPVSVRDVAREGLGIEFEKPLAVNAVRYDMHTRYAGLLGGTGVYLRSRHQVLAAIRDFAEAWRRERA